MLMRASLRVGACFHRRRREGGAIDVPDGRAGEAMDRTTFLDNCHKGMTADGDMIYEKPHIWTIKSWNLPWAYGALR
jgi:hypothetical protein